MKLSEEDKKTLQELDISENHFYNYGYRDELFEVYSEPIDENKKLQFYYQYVFNILKETCEREGIEYSTDTSTLFKDVLNELNNDSLLKEDLEKYGFDYTWFLHPEIIEEYIDGVVKACNTPEELEMFIDFLIRVYDNFRAYIADYFSSSMFEHLRELDDKREENVPDNAFDFPIMNQEYTGEDVFDDIEWDISPDEVEGIDDKAPFENVSQNTIDELTNEKIKKYIEFFAVLPLINGVYTRGKKRINELKEFMAQKKLTSYYEDSEFIDEAKRVMEHNPQEHIYHYHGTQDLNNNETADKIINEGLLITRDLDSTCYSEFTLDQLLLYSRGFFGEIGSRCIVIIDQPIIDGKPTEIVTPLASDDSRSFVPSGLQGLNNKPENIVDSKYIVGYIDKVDRKVVLNPSYYDYDRLKQNNK